MYGSLLELKVRTLDVWFIVRTEGEDFRCIAHC